MFLSKLDLCNNWSTTSIASITVNRENCLAANGVSKPKEYQSRDVLENPPSNRK